MAHARDLGFRAGLGERVGPASITINDEHNLFDDDRVRDAIESSMLGVDAAHLPIRQYNMSTSVTAEPEDFLVSYFESGTGDSPLYTSRYSYQQGVADMIQEISDSQ